MDYDITPYDDSTSQSLLEHAKKLIGKTFADVLHVKRTNLSPEKTTKITQPWFLKFSFICSRWRCGQKVGQRIIDSRFKIFIRKKRLTGH